METKYKVLHIFSGYGGGISSLILNLIENKSEEFQMDLLAFSYKDGEKFVERVSACGAMCYTMPRVRKEGYKPFADYVDRLMKTEKYDAVHCHIAGFHAIPFENIARKNAVPVFVLHAHTTQFESRVDRNAIAYAVGQYLNYRDSTCYMTCSDMAAEYVYGKRYLKKRKAYLIPNGIKMEAFRQVLTEEERANYRNEFAVPQNSKVILHVGRFNRPKNHGFIIDIAKKLAKEENDFVFLLIGDGELFDAVKSRVQELHLEKKVKLLGRRADIAKLMQFADCMILPSFFEGLPTVAVECQSAGTEILISDSVTKQCDMGLGLVKFLRIDSAEPWVNALKKDVFRHLPVEQCVETVKKNGFTAAAAGKYYCEVLKECIGTAAQKTKM